MARCTHCQYYKWRHILPGGWFKVCIRIPDSLGKPSRCEYFVKETKQAKII